MILANAAARRVCCSTCMVAFLAEAAAVVAAAMAKAANYISKVTEATCTKPKCPGDPVHASLVESLAIGPRTAK